MTTLTAAQILSEFNLVDYGNFSDGSDIEGRAVIGGNLTMGGTFYTGGPSGGSGGVAESSSTFAALTVFGSIQAGINVNNSGDVYVAGSGANNVHYNGGYRVTTAPSQNISAFESTLASLEATYAAAAANSTITKSGTNWTLNATQTGNIAVFTLTVAQLNTQNLNLSLAGVKSGETVLINVTGGGTVNVANDGMHLNGEFTNTTDEHYIMWNFENATSVSVSSWSGAILAIDANVTNTSDINGDVVAASLNSGSCNGGELHEFTYLGATTVCFMAGTLVATPDGARPIEDLEAGDLVLTDEGAAEPVLWLGRQTVSTVFGDSLRVLPIRIKAGALGESLPARDLLVSTCHAILVEGVLVQAGALVNGDTIVRESRVPETFTYYHVELANHALILAEGVAAETFIDNVTRMNFDNWDEHERLGLTGRLVPEMPYPRATSARQVPQAIKRALSQRALALAEPLALAS